MSGVVVVVACLSCVLPFVVGRLVVFRLLVELLDVEAESFRGDGKLSNDSFNSTFRLGSSLDIGLAVKVVDVIPIVEFALGRIGDSSSGKTAAKLSGVSSTLRLSSS